MTAKPPETGGRQGPAVGAPDERQRRSAEALRANLRRRKAQERQRAEDPAENRPQDSPRPSPTDPSKTG